MTKRLSALVLAIVLVFSVAVFPVGAANGVNMEIEASANTLYVSDQPQTITFTVVLYNGDPEANDVAGMNFDLVSGSSELVLANEATMLTGAFGADSATYYAPTFAALKLNGIQAAAIEDTEVALMSINATLEANAPAGLYTVTASGVVVSNTKANAVFRGNVSCSVQVLEAPQDEMISDLSGISVAAPEKGAPLSGAVYGLPSGVSGYTTWTSNGQTVSGVAEGGKSYTPTVVLTAGNGYSFATPVTAPAGWVVVSESADEVVLTRSSAYEIGEDGYVHVAWKCDGGVGCPSHKFTDVDQTKWYHEGIDYVVEQKLMAGISNTLFGTHDTTTRGMIVTILYRIAGEPAVNGKNNFSDVADGKYYTKAVIWAEQNKIVAGVGEGKFAPETAITREQMATMLYNYAKYQGYDVSSGAATKLSGFVDGASVSGYAVEAMKWACAEGLVAGVATNGKLYLDPQGNAERCQVASIVMRFCKNVAK